MSTKILTATDVEVTIGGVRQPVVRGGLRLAILRPRPGQQRVALRQSQRGPAPTHVFVGGIGQHRFFGSEARLRAWNRRVRRRVAEGAI
jgi:hypothetical protein